MSNRSKLFFLENGTNLRKIWFYLFSLYEYGNCYKWGKVSVRHT